MTLPTKIDPYLGLFFICAALKKQLMNTGINTLFIEPGSPWENGYIESFNVHLRDELSDREIFLSIEELRYVVERRRMDYNHYRPHSSLGYRTPAQFAAECIASASATPSPRQYKTENVDISLITVGT